LRESHNEQGQARVLLKVPLTQFEGFSIRADYTPRSGIKFDFGHVDLTTGIRQAVKMGEDTAGYFRGARYSKIVGKNGDLFSDGYSSHPYPTAFGTGAQSHGEVVTAIASSFFYQSMLRDDRRWGFSYHLTGGDFAAKCDAEAFRFICRDLRKAIQLSKGV
jgi:hypothetical protein